MTIAFEITDTVPQQLGSKGKDIMPWIREVLELAKEYKGQVLSIDLNKEQQKWNGKTIKSLQSTLIALNNRNSRVPKRVLLRDQGYWFTFRNSTTAEARLLICYNPQEGAH